MIFEERQVEKNNFSSRAIFSFLFISVIFLIVLFQVFSLQVSSYSAYELAALNNKTYSVPIQPLRGEIFDRNGHVIVRNIKTFDLITKPNSIDDVESFLQLIKPVIHLTESEVTQYLEKFKEKAFVNKELVLKKNLSTEEIARFGVRQFTFKDAFIGERYRRMSDYPEIFSHVLGYTSKIEGQDNLLSHLPQSHLKDAELVYANGLIQGVTGLEHTYNQMLSGTYGKRVYEINSRRQLGKVLEVESAVPGEDIYTHLDI